MTKAEQRKLCLSKVTLLGLKITGRCFELETQKISSNVFVMLVNVNTDVHKRSVSAKLSEI